MPGGRTMNAARTLKRVLAIGLAVTALTIGGAAVPAPTASAATLPDAHVGAPDVGYPGCPSSCRGSVQDGTALPRSGDVGYPGCTSGCGPVQAAVGVPS